MDSFFFIGLVYLFLLYCINKLINRIKNLEKWVERIDKDLRIRRYPDETFDWDLKTPQEERRLQADRLVQSINGINASIESIKGFQKGTVEGILLRFKDIERDIRYLQEKKKSPTKITVKKPK